MPFCNEVPATEIPDFPGGDQWDSANELKGEPWTAVDPAKAAAMTYPPEDRALVQPDPTFNPVITTPRGLR
jgi:hypothetical protein